MGRSSAPWSPSSPPAARAPRRGARCSRSATRSSRSSRSRARRRAPSTRCAANSPASSIRRAGLALSALPPLVPLGRERARRRRPGVRRARYFYERHHRRSRRAAAHIAARCRARAGRAVAADRAGGAARDRRLGRAVRHRKRDKPARRAGAPDRQAREAVDGARAKTRRRAGAGAPARAAVRGDHPRAEERRHRGRRRRPAGADRAYRGDGPDGARRRAAAAGRRSRARDRAQEPAVRPERGAAVRARLESHAARCARRCAPRPATPRFAGRDGALETARRAARQQTPFAFLRACAGPERGRAVSRAGSGRRPTTRSTNSSISRSTTSAARRRRCRASSPGCAPRRPKSSATWRSRATRCG